MRPRPLPLALCTLLLVGVPLFAQDEQDAPPPPLPTTGGADPSSDAFRMGSPPGLPDGLAEEDMWPAASAEGWKQPVLIKWQRTFEDALKVARTENRPVMVAVNMDGEIASEHFAGVRYRSVDTAQLMSKYACVIASVYRHTPRDYDEHGNRVCCPRFGTVTCGEHINAERELYGKYFDGRRISPRHIVLDLEEQETMDVYYSWDTATVTRTFVKGVEGWPEPSELHEPSLEELVGSARVEHRESAERAYREGDAAIRRRLLQELVANHQVDQIEVLRQAIFGFDLELARLARRALARCETDAALDLIAEALKTPLDADERTLLLDAVERLGDTRPRARSLLALHRGLAVESTHIPLEAAVNAAAYGANARGGVNLVAREDAVETRPKDPAALLSFSEALVSSAVDAVDPRFGELLYRDAARAAREAEQLGAAGPRLDAVLALVELHEGSWGRASERGVAAVEGGALQIEEGVEPALSHGARMQLTHIFARSRQQAIRIFYRSNREWPSEWLSDVNASFDTLANEPMSEPTILLEHHDFLRWVGASPRADQVLEGMLTRFPNDAGVHERLRARLLYLGGPAGLEKSYAERLAQLEGLEDTPSQLTWFAGYASLVAAEHFRRRGEFENADAAYERGVANYERNIERFPEGQDTSTHFIVLARAGQARMALEQGRLEEATEELLGAIALRPDSGHSADGLNLTPQQTVKMLLARLLDAGDDERAARVQVVHDELEATNPRPTAPVRQGRGGRRGGNQGAGGR